MNRFYNNLSSNSLTIPLKKTKHWNANLLFVRLCFDQVQKKVQKLLYAGNCWSRCTNNPPIAPPLPPPEHSSKRSQPLAENANRETVDKPFSVMTLRQKPAERPASVGLAAVHVTVGQFLLNRPMPPAFGLCVQGFGASFPEIPMSVYYGHWA